MQTEANTGYHRLETQIEWYDRKSISNHRCFKVLKLLELVVASAIPLVATHAPSVAGAFGVVVVILEGTQHIFQFQYNWLLYRSACEALGHEKHLYIEKAGMYSQISSESARMLLAQRVESLLSTEHSRWVMSTTHRKTATQPNVTPSMVKGTLE